MMHLFAAQFGGQYFEKENIHCEYTHINDDITIAQQIYRRILHMIPL